MANEEPEVIRQQMEETRTALTEKLETLEQQMVQTVQGATAAVAETVENVKDAVQETVETVKDGVQQTVSTVKDTFDLPLQVQRHPWGMVLGAVAAGYLTGWLLEGRASRRGPRPRTRPADYPDASPLATTSNGGIRTGRRGDEASEAQEPGWFSQLSETFGTELSKLKGLAVGTAVGVLRDAIAQAAPEQMKDDLANAFNRITTKLGGEPIQGPILERFRQEDSLVSDPEQPRPVC